MVRGTIHPWQLIMASPNPFLLLWEFSIQCRREMLSLGQGMLAAMKNCP